MKKNIKINMVIISVLITLILITVTILLRSIPKCKHCYYGSSKDLLFGKLQTWLSSKCVKPIPLDPNVKDFKSIKFRLLPLPPKLDQKLIPDEYKNKLFYSPNGFTGMNGDKWHIILRENNKDEVVFTVIGIRENGNIDGKEIKGDKSLLQQIDKAKPVASN